MLNLVSYLMCVCIFLYIHMWLAVLHSVAVGISLSLHVCHVQATYIHNHALYELNSHNM